MNPIVMTLLLIVGWGVFAYSVRRRWKLMMVGASEDRSDQPGRRLRATWTYAITQLRMRRYPLAGFSHMLIFSGFMVLLLRSMILWARGFDASFSCWLFGEEQMLGKIYSLVKDLFAVLVILGSSVFLYYRTVGRLARMKQSTEGLIIILIIIVMMLADIFYDGASMALESSSVVAETVGDAVGDDPDALADSPVFHGWAPAGSIARYIISALPTEGLKFVQHLGFWAHVILVFVFLNLLPYSKHFHVITAIPNVYMQSLQAPGRLPPLEDIEGKLEREETLGIRRIDQFSWKSILDFYTCTECGRCSDHCPATKTGKKLSPMHFTVDLRNFLYKHEAALVAGGANGNAQGSEGEAGEGDLPEHRKDLIDGVIDPEVLWACTTCRACEQECPVFISYVDKIVDMRRYLAQERGEFPNELQTAFRGLESAGNPYGSPPDERTAWAKGLDIKTLAEHPEAEVLFWVGCAPAFDARAKSVTIATAKLLTLAGVDFAILGDEEQCTGDPARRAGNEYLFQMMAQANIEILNGYGVDKKKIVTICPHCYNTLAHEYRDLGGYYDVVHHTTFLAGLIKEGKLSPTTPLDKTVVYHDSCYLGRYNEVYDAPREALRAIPGLTLVEPAQTRDRGMCCGAGGAQMFKEEEPGDKRVDAARTEQLLDTGADVISSACPFCMRMITNGLSDKDREDVPQLDVAEMLLDAVGETT